MWRERGAEGRKAHELPRDETGLWLVERACWGKRAPGKDVSPKVAIKRKVRDGGEG